MDFYVYSFYKTFGPLLAMMYGKYEILKELDGLNHYFIGKDQMPYKFQPGNVNYELTYGLNGIFNYFTSLHNFYFPEVKNAAKRDKISNNFALITTHEEKLTMKLLNYLNNRKDVKIISRQDSNRESWVSTISFVHDKFISPDVVAKIDKYNIGIRYSDFYAKTITSDHGLVEKGGMNRVSIVHYNSLGEGNNLLEGFVEIFE